MRSVRKAALEGDSLELYLASFSEAEKIPLENIARALGGGAFLNEYSDNGRFIGFVYGFVHGDAMFFVYFATVPEVRGKGYGGRILESIRSEFPDKRIFLVTEPLDRDAPDLDIRRRRQDFYRRNGCSDTGVRLLSDAEWFDSMFVQGELSGDEMRAVVSIYEDVHNGRVRSDWQIV
jgi:GNAT superfamily N-acetyltransferase